MREVILFFTILFCSVLAGSVYHPSFLSEDEIDHVRMERGEGALEPCNEDNLMNFLAEIQVINPESIVKFACLDDIQPQCKKVAENLEKIKTYLKGCVPPSQPDLYYQLIKGVETLHQKLCTDSDFKKKFQTVHTCLYELRNDFEDCEGPADWNENSDDDLACKAYKQIADCYYIKSAKVCGKEAANLAKELLETIIDSVLTINCAEVKKTPPVQDAMPAAYIKKTTTSKGYRIIPPSTVFILLEVIKIKLLYF